MEGEGNSISNQKKYLEVLCLERIEDVSGDLILSGWGGLSVSVRDPDALMPYANALPASWAAVP